VQPDCNNDSIAASAPGLSPSEDAAGPGRRAWLDRVGVGVSLTCAVHCVGAALLAAAPAFAASSAPALGEGLEWMEGALLWIALGVGSFALVPSYLREHRRALPLVLFAVGLGSIALARALDGEFAEIAGTVTGVALVAGAHVVNLRSRSRFHSRFHTH